jgi:hypothetical protein
LPTCCWIVWANIFGSPARRASAIPSRFPGIAAGPAAMFSWHSQALGVWRCQTGARR